jgi:oxygen-independent coproporphyrinogen-3 oxidase
MTEIAAPALITDELLNRLDTPGPRYTSYPTADRFVDGFAAVDYTAALARLARPAGAAPAPLSVYVHIPFCESVCYYCACNKVVTRHHDRAKEYLDALEREVALNLEHLGPGHRVTQLHLGGGTPTFLSDEELTRLMTMLSQAWAIAPDAERSIEVDPRTVDGPRLKHLAALGFNRLSLGVQDFDPAVQKAVHREQSQQSVAELLKTARLLGFRSTNVDLIYGLPQQTPESFACTLVQVGELEPERIALYAYAHLPQRFKPQRRIDASALPRPEHKIRMLSMAIEAFAKQGYRYIGMDHFARHGEALEVAWRQGRLHRNFQGYTTQPECDLIGLGVSAIGHVGSTYSQNAKTLPEYYEALKQGRLPVVRGLEMTDDDLLRHEVIMAIMCQGRVDMAAFEAAHGVAFRQRFAAEMGALQGHVENGLVSLTEAALEVTPLGWYFVRAVAMVFDRHLQADRDRARFSRIV